MDRAASQNPSPETLASAVALILAVVATGKSRISVADPRALTGFAGAMLAFGAGIAEKGGAFLVDGVGNGCLLEPESPVGLDSSWQAALMLGIAGSYDMVTRLAAPPLSDDVQRGLREALGSMGVQFLSPDGLAVHGPKTAAPVSLDLASTAPETALAVLLAGLNAPGTTVVTMPAGAPQGVAGLLRAFGVNVGETADAVGRTIISVAGQGDLSAAAIDLSGSR